MSAVTRVERASDETGALIRKFHYPEVTIRQTMFYHLYSDVVFWFCIIGGLIGGQLFIPLLILSLWGFLRQTSLIERRKENARLGVGVYEKGLMLGETWKAWDCITSVEFHDPTDYKDCRPYLRLSFDDESQFDVYQRLESFSAFYLLLYQKGLPNARDCYPEYDMDCFGRVSPRGNMHKNQDDLLRSAVKSWKKSEPKE